MLNVTIFPAVTVFMNFFGEPTFNSANIKSYEMTNLCRNGIMDMKKEIALLSIATDTSWSTEDNSTFRRLFLILNLYFSSMNIRRDV
jgi:hypothetical protein